MIKQAAGMCAGPRCSHSDIMCQLEIMLSPEFVQHLLLWQGSFKDLRVPRSTDAWKTCMSAWQFGSAMLQRLRCHLTSMSWASASVDACGKSHLHPIANMRGTCRHLVGIAGMPGSGKTTAARHISDSMNKLWKQRHPSDQDCTNTLPMDGKIRRPACADWRSSLTGLMPHLL